MLKHKLPKAKKCRMCPSTFIQRSSLHSCCSIPCAQAYAKRLRERKEAREAKADRKVTRERKEAIKPLQQLFNECKTVAQKYSRWRDRFDGCISCDKPANWHGQWHGSHFRPAGNFKAVALNLLNIHKACSECNNFKSGNLIPFQDSLIKKIGQDKVEWLKSQTKPHTFTREYLMRYKKVMSKRLNRLMAREM